MSANPRNPVKEKPRPKWHLHPGVRKEGELTRGERAADAMRNGMGSWTFVFAFLAAMALWAIINTGLHIGGHHKGFDPYPYILLNLILSTMAGLQAAALLIAAKRSDQISSEIALHTLQNTELDRDLLKENTELTKQVKMQTDLLDEIHRHLTAITDHLKIDAGRFDPPPGGSTQNIG